MHAVNKHWDGALAKEDEDSAACRNEFALAFEERARAFTEERQREEGKESVCIGRRKRRRQQCTVQGQEATLHHPEKRQAVQPEWQTAAREGDVGALRALRRQGKWRHDLEDKHGSTAEHWCAGGGHLEALKYCLSLRFEQCRKHGQLLECSSFAKIEKPTAKKSYQDVLDSVQWQDAECTCEKELRRRQDGRSALHWAARNGHCGVVDFLARDCAFKVDCSTFDGTTPLMHAVFGAQLAAAKRLVALGANPRHENEWKCDLTHWIAISRCQNPSTVTDLCDWIASLGLSFSKAQKEGRTPLHKAAFINNTSVVDWVLSNLKEADEKAVLTLCDQGGQTARHLASQAGHHALARRLGA